MKMRYRLLSICLVLCTLVSLVSPAAAAADSTHPFGDVKAGDWYNDYVTYVYENSLFDGVSDTRFAPKKNMTRGMVVTVLGRLAGVKAEEYTETVFSDVDPDAWYGPYVA